MNFLVNFILVPFASGVWQDGYNFDIL